jgi:hypothetical protein
LPKFVEIFENNTAYIVLLTADPSHNSQPAGAVVPAKGRIVPGGTVLKNVILLSCNVELCF